MYLIVRGESITLRRNIVISREFPPRLECPDVTTAVIGQPSYILSCNIVSHPRIPRQNVTWEFLGKPRQSFSL